MILQTRFSPLPEIQTDRLLLRQIKLSDAPEVFYLRSNPEVLKYIGKEPCQSIKEAAAFIGKVLTDLEAGDGVAWAITLKDDPEIMIGHIGFWRMDKPAFRAEIGYLIHPQHWGKGLIKEAIKATLQFGFQTMNLHSVEARISPQNLASAAVLEANGFIKEGHLKESFCFREKFEDTVIYSILNK